MPETATRPNEVFAYLASALNMQSGFGLCYLFSDDTVGLSWLHGRLQEHLVSDPTLRQKSALRSVYDFSNAADAIVKISGPSELRTVVWCWFPAEATQCEALLSRMNEQRQRLLASGHFLVLALPRNSEHAAPAWAPDLWSIRSLVYKWQITGRTLSSEVTASWATGKTVASTTAEHEVTTLAISAWKRIYAEWKSNPTDSQPSVDLGLLASEQSKKLRLFTQATAYAEQALEVTQNDLGRANALQALGDMKSRLGLVQEAQDLYTQAITLYEKEQADLGRANALQALGDLKRRLGLVQEAQDLYTQAITLYEKEQDDLGRANALQALGELKSRLGLVQEAQDLYTQAITLYEKEQADLGLGYAWAELARIWRVNPARLQEADNASKMALKHARKAGSPPALQQITDLLTEAGFVLD